MTKNGLQATSPGMDSEPVVNPGIARRLELNVANSVLVSPNQTVEQANSGMTKAAYFPGG